MTIINAYIGDLQSPNFSWEDGNWQGNIPSRLSPFLPNASAIFNTLFNEIKDQNINVKRTDWGAIVAQMTPSEIQNFIINDCKVTLTQQDMNDLQRLDPNKKYGLVVCESV